MSALLLVDSDPLSRRVLDVSLRKAGFSVTTASDGSEALAKIGAKVPDLVVCATRLRELDGFALVETLREKPGAADVPVVFIASGESEDDRARAAELGVADYVTRPVYVRQLVARLQLLLARRVQRVADGTMSATTDELGLAELLQSLEAQRATGIVAVTHGGQDARIYLRDGNVVDAELGRSRGADVVARTLAWEAATLRVELAPVDNEDLFECTTSALLAVAMDRLEGIAPPEETPAAPAARERSVSTAPWTREAEEVVPTEGDLIAAGVPRAASRTLRRGGLVAAGMCGALLLVAGLRSVRARQLHEAELARGGAALSAAAVVGVGEPQVQPPPPVPGAGQDVPSATVVSDAIANEVTAAPAAADVALVPVATPSATPDPRETALDVRAELHSRSALVRDAHRALLAGDTAKAISLSLQAVAANGADADAWLTLAAARKAAGDTAGAREAYRRCIASAHTFGVMSCRALADRGQ